MPIAPEKLKMLCVRGEQAKVDFKAADYSWAEKERQPKAELAKDLMSMANTMKPGDRPSYILVGVKEDEERSLREIVGIPQSDHKNDADLHVWTENLLNRNPDYTYGVVDVDGKSVGVYEIKPGKRPIFSSKDIEGKHPSGHSKGILRANTAYYRNGSSDTVADPDLVLECGAEDDPVRREIQENQLLEQAAKSALHVQFRNVGSSTAQQNHQAYVKLEVFNESQAGIFIEKSTATFKPKTCIGLDGGGESVTEPFEMKKTIIRTDYAYDRMFRWDTTRVNEIYSGLINKREIKRVSTGCVDLHFEIEIRGALGERKTLEIDFQPVCNVGQPH